MTIYSGWTDKYWEDWQIGDKVITQGLTITESHIVNWASLSGDWSPLHMDKEFGKSSFFGTTIAHGPLIYSLITGLCLRSEFGRNIVVAFLGIDRMRIPNPVKPVDTIHCELEVIGMKENRKSDRGIQIWAHHVKNQKGELILEFESSFMLKRRPSEGERKDI